jgi:hypothetical protein
VVDGVDGVVEEPPPPSPMSGQSPSACDPPLAAKIGCGSEYAGGELAPLDPEPLDPEPPAAIATVAQTAAATSTATTANQKVG